MTSQVWVTCLVVVCVTLSLLDGTSSLSTDKKKTVTGVLGDMDREIENVGYMEMILANTVYDTENWVFVDREKKLQSYHLSKKTYTYKQAKAYCASQQGYLARIKTVGEYNTILQLGILTKGRRCDGIYRGFSYRGNVSTTVSGRTCQRWDKNFPHKRYWTPKANKHFPGEPVSRAKNYCRNPSKSGKPWCYTTDTRKRWEYCNYRDCAGIFVGADSLMNGVWRWNDGTPLPLESNLWSVTQPDYPRTQKCARLWAFLPTEFLDSWGCDVKQYALCERST